jgi:hypothetical protein
MNMDQAKTARIQPQQSGLSSPQANLSEFFFKEIKARCATPAWIESVRSVPFWLDLSLVLKIFLHEPDREDTLYLPQIASTDKPP